MNKNKIAKELIKTWFVTGASSGVGKEMTQQLLARGYNVIAVARRVPDFNHPNVLCLSVDVTKPETIKKAVYQGIEKFSKIDVLVNNAGVSTSVLCEDETAEHIKDVFEVNYFGTFNTIKELLPHFRENKNGTIINNTSMHGLSIRWYGTAYCSSKHAVEGLTGVLRHETSQFCRVMAFELGWFKGTEIGKNTVAIKNVKEEYKGLKHFYKPFNYGNFINKLPEAVGVIINTVENAKLPRHLMLGNDCIFKARAELDVLKNDIHLADKNLKQCVKFIYPYNLQSKLIAYISYYKYKIMKNFVFGKDRKKYKEKAKKYHEKVRYVRGLKKCA